MQILGVSGERLAAKLVEQKSDSEFTNPGNSGDAQVFEIEYAGKNATYKPGDKVIIEPGSAITVGINGQQFFVFNNNQVLCTVKE